MFSNSKAIIENIDGLYTARTKDGEVIEVSHDMERISERIYYAERNADIRILHDGKEMTIEEYETNTASTIYRFTYGDSEASGFIGVIDRIRKGRYSKPQLFDNGESMKQFIIDEQKNDGHFIVWGRGKERLDMSNLGIYDYRLLDEQIDISRLSKELAKERARRNNELVTKEGGNK